ncbi:MAG: HAD-IA family hydrolase [Gemmatimonadota bacterium]|nr:HAD-IA family hydrolase [bacterium]MDE2874491.1 HAD-IA family hydrolase [Gemmatimonadota bacterium]
MPTASGVHADRSDQASSEPSHLDPDRFDLLTFDCYGTLVDWEAGIITAVREVCAAHGAEPGAAHGTLHGPAHPAHQAAVPEAVPGDGAILSAFGAAEHIVQAERYRTYREVLALTLDRMGHTLGFSPTQAECDAFAASVGDWPPFPDTVDALARLATRYRLGIVSNVDDDLFARTARHLNTDFAWIVTAQQVGSYKPAPAHFKEMVMRSGIPVNRTLHIAQSLFHDIAPASALGYATVHVDRPCRGGGGGATPASNARPDATAADMAAVAHLLGVA